MLKLLIPPPVVALVTAAAMYFLSGYVPGWSFAFPYQSLAALILCVVALSLDVVAIGLFWRNDTTTNPMSPDNTARLVTDGSYRITRNPMYLGLALLLTALGIWLGNFVFIPAVLVFTAYITQFQIKPEEEVLRQKFGEAYEAYCRRVRRWI